ncbi:MAG TPA: YciI family protein [bacterium]|nr:YciI family protein [bacterium]HNC49281.1 YciI family protein [bacterium]
MQSYMMIFRGGDDAMVKMSPDEIQQHMGQWFAWVEKLTKEGRYVSGEPLVMEGKVVRAKGVITDGPFAEGKELVGGFFIVKAKSIDEACDMAKVCPSFQFEGATVEIRQVQEMEHA